jgi:uncharacterized protein (DUF488 family)
LEIATIGFTRTTATYFFERLTAARVQRVIDVRLHNASQLAGFAKQADLPYFLEKLCGISYEHDLRLAPTEDLLKKYREDKDWDRYAAAFTRLMRRRNITTILDRDSFARKTALLCSEPTADHCHRRLVAEILSAAWPTTVEHL